METSKNSTVKSTEEQLMFFQEDSHVSRTPQQESEKAKKTLDTSGRKCLESFEKFSRHSSWAKMFAALLVGQGDWFSKRCKLTWKLRGTKYNRVYFQLSTLRTNDTGFGLLHTPRVVMIDEPNEKFIKRMGDRTERCYPHLAAQVTDYITKGLLPTPTTFYTRQDWTMGEIQQKQKEVKEETIRKGKHHTGNGFGLNLAHLAMNGLIPTPTAREHKGGKTGNIENEKQETEQLTGRHDQRCNWNEFPTQSPIRNGNDGVPSWLVRSAIEAGGNAIVPQVAFEIFKAIEQTIK